MDFWRTGFPVSDARELGAARAESDGWDGAWVMDSQNLAADPYVAMTVAAQATKRIMLGTGVTNPVTRHPAVTAAAIASLQVLSGGRAVLGIGRGDSALAHIGQPPSGFAFFERYVAIVQQLLNGESVPVSELPAIAHAGPMPLSANQPDHARLQWLPPGYHKVPVEIVASGPRMIKLAARHADWITLSIGADPERVRWAMDVAREELAQCGRRPDDVCFSVYICLCVHPEIEQARKLVCDMVSTLARFNSMHGSVSGPWTSDDAEVINGIAASYEMTRHSQRGRLRPGIITPEFVDRFAILGPADKCVTRLEQLQALGVQRAVIASMPRAGNPTLVQQADSAFFSQVAPALRS